MRKYNYRKKKKNGEFVLVVMYYFYWFFSLEKAVNIVFGTYYGILYILKIRENFKLNIRCYYDVFVVLFIK